MIMPINFLKNKKLVIGTAQFGMNYGIANQNGQVDENEIESILNFAYENNINTLDTAKIYGNSEKSIGNYLKKTDKSWDVITKVKYSDKSIFEQIQDSKEKLTVRPFVILAHTAELYLNQEFQSKLQEAKVKGLINRFGVSLYNEKEINQVLATELKPEIIQLPMNILDTRLYRCGILSKLFNKGIEIHVRSAFLQGLFYLSKTDLKRRFSDALPQLDKLKSIAAKVDLTIAELSLLWLVNLKEVRKVIIGLDDVNQLKAHLVTLKKNVDSSVFEEALSIRYENENILNPSLWPVKS
jgi:aryl-alcohol dehydrogenase-like predicted oxidoreductase